MSLSAMGVSPAGTAGRTNTRGSHLAEDALRDSFAGTLAGAMHAAAPKPHVQKPKEGNSELDGPSDDETEDAKGASASADEEARTSRDGSGSPSGGVVRSVGALDPALQEKLARVMARMKNETGHDVTVEETLRSQSRQDMLFAQGRDTAGPIVTWTQNSKHTQGKAVDLLLDGGAAGPDAYALLQRIANEEGLRTLGAKDPGHLELPSRGTAAPVDAKTLMPDAPADASGPGGVSVARVAQVARVAEVKVAAPAEVARVATVAHAGGVSGGSARGGKSSTSDSGAGSGGDQRGYGSLGATFTLRDAPAAAPAAAVTGTHAAERTARVMEAIEDAPARPLSQISMSVDAGNGAVDRVHVTLRGATINTTIDAADLRAAQTMGAKSDELVRSLTRDGLEVESLRVRAAAGSAAPAVTQASQSGSGSSAGSRFERGTPWDQSDRQQAQQDGRRHQQREQRKDRQS